MKVSTDSTSALIFSTIILGTFFSGFVRQYLLEKKLWNNGVCRANGIKWERKSNADGIRVYKAGNETIRITFNSIGKGK